MLKHSTILKTVCSIIVFVAIITVLFFFTYPSKVILAGKVFSVEVSDTQYLLERGLSGHRPLSDDEGMFFVFQIPGDYGFWMKDMLFPIDIIWMNQNLKIIHIEKSLSPKTYPKVFYPNAKALYVLEISAGESDSLGLKIGDSVQFIRK